MWCVRWLAAVFLLVLFAFVAGCGGGGSSAPEKPLGAGGLTRALQLARDAGRLDMRLSATTTRPGRGTRPQFDAEGEIDLGARAGSAKLMLADSAEMQLPDMALTWDADSVEANGRSLPREQARTSGGQVGMLPDEAQGLAELVADAEDVRERGNGRWTFTVRPEDAVERGIPPQPEPGNAWRGEASAAADGRLRQVSITLPTPALGTTIAAGVATLELTLG